MSEGMYKRMDDRMYGIIVGITPAYIEAEVGDNEGKLKNIRILKECCCLPDEPLKKGDLIVYWPARFEIGAHL